MRNMMIMMLMITVRMIVRGLPPRGRDNQHYCRRGRGSQPPGLERVQRHHVDEAAGCQAENARQSRRRPRRRRRATARLGTRKSTGRRHVGARTLYARPGLRPLWPEQRAQGKRFLCTAGCATIAAEEAELRRRYENDQMQNSISYPGVASNLGFIA